MSQCSLDKVKKSYTCLSEKHLVEIFSTVFPNVTPPVGKKNIWRMISNKFTECDDEICWLTKTELRTGALASKILQNDFLAPKPQNIKGWLSNFDINKVMRQLERLFTNFMFIGPVSSDIENYVSELANFSIEDIYKTHNKAKIGIIVNMDKHTGPGTHWTAMFINVDLNGATVEYYDSLGDKPPSQIKRFMETTKNTITEKLKIPCEIIVNAKVHQRENSECGVFSINYIFERLYNKSPTEISGSGIQDIDMHAMRKVIFR